MLIDVDVEPCPLVTGPNEGPPSVNTGAYSWARRLKKSWLCSPSLRLAYRFYRRFLCSFKCIGSLAEREK